MIYFPIRHHSPACAWHLEQLIRERRPRSILVEGPSSFTPLIPLILHEKTQAPIAVYTSFVGEEQNAPDSPMKQLLGPPRFAAYYPFCDYSPELVALRVGSELGATLRFIDLDYPEQILAEQQALQEAGAPRVESLLAERHFKRSRFLQTLARRAGCRDHNDLWDHLFETRLGGQRSNGVMAQWHETKISRRLSPHQSINPTIHPSIAFLVDVACWCYFARLDAEPGELQADGTLAREVAMAANIRSELAKPGAAQDGPVLVVTGGFHTVVLPELVQQSSQPPAAAPAEKKSALTCLVRYSFEQLDALNGYAAGMPSPFYYDQLWHAARSRAGEPSVATPADPRKKGAQAAKAPLDTASRRSAPVSGAATSKSAKAREVPPPLVSASVAAAEDGRAPAEESTRILAEPFTELAAKVLVQLGQLTRRKKLAVALSPADEIAALEQARRLAALRGHPGPTREDLLDGVRSCFVKGAIDAEGELLLGLARHALAGTSIGEVPAEAGVPPLVEDFRAAAKKLRLNISDSVRRKTSLDLYRKTTHRLSSRFLHSLGSLEVPFATMMAGPDFVKGQGLERLHEHWEYQWTPQTESRLVEASVYGATVEEAAANRLVQAIGELESQGRGRSAAEGVAMLVHACRMGLHRHTARLRSLIAAQISEDPSFKSLADSLSQLLLLWESREPLEAHQLGDLPVLIRAAYERACYLLHNLADTPVEAAQEQLQALIVVRDLLRTEAAAGEFLDPALFFEPLGPLMRHPKAPALLAGGAAGLLHSGARISEAELLQVLSGFLNSATTQAGAQMGFLIGLLRTCRELAWRQPALVEAVEKLLAAWSEEEFIERLPHLRLAFADLTPRETDQVAEVVAQIHGGQKLGVLAQPALTEGEMLEILRLNATVEKAMREDGLGGWIGLVDQP